MGKNYISIPSSKAYRLINAGALGIICSRSSSGDYDMAPVAWLTPEENDPVTRLLLSVDREHQTTQNIIASREFAVAIPHITQVDLVRNLGSISGSECDKISKFGIETINSEKICVKMPSNCIGYIECILHKSIEDDEIILLIGEVIYTRVDRLAYSNRLLSEKPEGKAIHHIGGNSFATLGDKIIE
jgi:flavin reductase (DIM6/NTAB) family NADH-FMN oxidoreductase RutF